MPLDHFVPQVHLRKFYSQTLENRLLHAHRKHDGFEFTPNSRAICRRAQGNTNNYLDQPRAIEEFLTTVEPNYNRAVAALADEAPSLDDIYVVAGYIAYILTCTPAMLRIESWFMRQAIEHAAIALDSAGRLPPMPGALGVNVADALRSGRLEVRVDQMYPHAVGVTQIQKRLRAFANSQWTLIHNHTAAPFVTSDFPVAYGPEGHVSFEYRTFPLSPTLAVQITTDAGSTVEDTEFTFPNHRLQSHQASENEANEIVRMTMKCAESEIYSSETFDALRGVLAQATAFRVEPTLRRIGGYEISGTHVAAMGPA